MKARLCIVVALLLKTIVTSPPFAQTQNKPADSASDAPKLTADYPRNPPGVLIQGSAWMPITLAAPFKTHTKHAAASFFSDGVVPAAIVADYEGPHAAVEVEPGQPMICICHIIGMPGNPVLVRLHPKKQFRELDGGNLPIFGSKVAEAKKNDLIPVEISQPESTVWLVRPKVALPAGEYALMLGTQNIDIFPFTVIPPGGDSTKDSPNP